MFNFTPSIQGVAYIDLTQEEDTVKMPPFKGNITSTWKIDINLSDFFPDNTSSVRQEPWTHAVHSTHTSLGEGKEISIPREHLFSLALTLKR